MFATQGHDEAAGTELRRPSRAVDDELTELAGHLHAAEARLVALAEEADRHEHWGGFASVAQWLAWRSGMSMHQARERVGLARALRDLPLLRAAFEAGQLSYAKTKTVALIATDATEAQLVSWALHASTAQMMKVTAGVRRVRRLAPTAARAGSDRLSWARRYLRWWFDEDGMLVLSGRLPGDVGAVIVKALEAACDALAGQLAELAGVDTDTAADDATTDDEHEEWLRRQTEAFAAADDAAYAAQGHLTGAQLAAQALAELDAGAQGSPSPGDEDGVEGERPWLPPPLQSAPVDEQTPTPDVMADGRDGGDDLSLFDHRDIEAEDELGARRADALGWLSDRMLTVFDRDLTAAQHERYLVIVTADAAALSGDGSAATVCGIDGGGPVSPQTAQRLACEGSVITMYRDPNGDIIRVDATKRAPNRRMRRALQQRDGTCQFPGCPADRDLIPHHIVWYSTHGPTVMRNLVLVCRFHHRLIHDGGYQVTSGDADTPRWARPDGTPIPTTIATRGTPHELVSNQTAAGIRPRPPDHLPGYDHRANPGDAVSAYLDLERATPRRE